TFSGVDSVIWLWRLEFPDGKPRRKEANELPFSALLVVRPSDEVVSFSNSKNPAPLPGIVESTPFLRKSTPPLNVWVPTNFETEPLAPIDFQLISVGSIAPNVRPSLSYPRIRTWGNF